MDAFRNMKYNWSMNNADVPTLLHATRLSLNTINIALAKARERITASSRALVSNYIEQYNTYESEHAQYNAQSDYDVVKELHKRVIKLRRTVLTDSNRLNIPGLIPTSLSDYIPASGSLTPLSVPSAYVPQPITSSSVALSNPQQQYGQPSAPPAAGQRRHQPRRSQSMPFGPGVIVEESEIQVTRLTMPPSHRPPPPSSRPYYGAQTPTASTYGGAGYATPVTPSHGHSASVTSTQTFGRGTAVPAGSLAGSRPSYDSDQSLGSSTGDISVTLHGGAAYQAAGSAMAAPSNAQALFQHFSAQYPQLPVDQIWNLVRNYVAQQQQQHAQPRRQ